MQGGLYSPDTFDEDEYFYYDHPENGDMHEVVTGKFFAFKGPTDKKQNYYTRRPSDYLDVFRVKGIKAVVRLNKKEYAASTLGGPAVSLVTVLGRLFVGSLLLALTVGRVA